MHLVNVWLLLQRVHTLAMRMESHGLSTGRALGQQEQRVSMRVPG